MKKVYFKILALLLLFNFGFAQTKTNFFIGVLIYILRW